MNALNWKQVQKGFTLIELIITIVIIGVLAAVAIPKFLDLTGDAQLGVARGVGGAAASASSVNYARRAGGTGGVVALTCAALEPLVDMPTGYAFTGTLVAGATGECTITFGSPARTTTFFAYGA